MGKISEMKEMLPGSQVEHSVDGRISKSLQWDLLRRLNLPGPFITVCSDYVLAVMTPWQGGHLQFAHREQIDSFGGSG